MTREDIVEGLKLLEDNMVHFDKLQNDKGEWIDVHELLFEAIQALERANDDWKEGFDMGWEEAKVFYEEEPTEKPMCDRNICISNEYSGIGCDKCIVNKAEQEPCERFEWGIDGNVYKITKAKDGKEICQQVCEDAVSRKDIQDYIAKYLSQYLYDDVRSAVEVIDEYIGELPSVTQKSGKWKECKYFEYDSVAKVDGIPLIVAHEICNKWGDGCKTSEDGYCYLFEPQESEE